MYEQVAGWSEALERVRLGPDRCYRALYLPAIMVVPPRHTPAIALPALAIKPGIALTHVGKLLYERAHVAWGRCGKQQESTHSVSPDRMVEVRLLSTPARLRQAYACWPRPCRYLLPALGEAHHCAVIPPSITNSAPVTYADSSDAR